MSGKTPAWSLIIVAGGGDITPTLESFCRLDIEPETHEILAVLPPAACPAALAVAAKHPDRPVRVIPCDGGSLAAWHTGAKEAAGSILTFTSDRVEAEADFGSNVIAAFADPEAVLATGPVRPVFESEPPAWAENYWTRQGDQWVSNWLQIFDLGDEPGEIPATYVWDINYSIRRERFFSLGGFHPGRVKDDAAWLGGHGVKGLNLRAEAEGCKALYVPGLKVTHRLVDPDFSEATLAHLFFSQGRADSFTEIRQKGDLDKLGVCLPQAAHPDKPEDMHKRIQNAYVDGFFLHQCAVKRSRAMFDWVTRADYFDCGLPETEQDFRPVRGASAILLKEPYEVLRDSWQGCRYAILLAAGERLEEALKVMRQLDAINPMDPEITTLTDSLISRMKE